MILNYFMHCLSLTTHNKKANQTKLWVLCTVDPNNANTHLGEQGFFKKHVSYLSYTPFNSLGEDLGMRLVPYSTLIIHNHSGVLVVCHL